MLVAKLMNLITFFALAEMDSICSLTMREVVMILSKKVIDLFLANVRLKAPRRERSNSILYDFDTLKGSSREFHEEVRQQSEGVV